jgi:integrase
MGAIQYTYRRKSGIYVVRRKICFLGQKPQPISLTLGTRILAHARIRAAAACATLDRVVATMNRNIVLYGGSRSASELAKIARCAAEAQLGFAIRDHSHGRDAEAELAARVHADFYLLAAAGGGIASLSPEMLEQLRTKGRCDRHLYWLQLLIRHNQGCQPLSNAHLAAHLESFGLSFNPASADHDREIVLTGWAKGQELAASFNDPLVQAQPWPLEYLLASTQADNAHAPAVAHSQPVSTAGISTVHCAPADGAGGVTSAPANETQPLLSEVIDEVVDHIVASGKWSGGATGTGQDGRRLLKQFVWMVGDKPVDRVGQRDVSRFVNLMLKMPKSIRAQSLWHEPFGVAQKKFPKLVRANTRSGVTINKDLAYLSTFATAMVGAGFWHVDQITPLKLSHKIERRHKRTVKTPWTLAHVSRMFSCPIFCGNQGSKRRLRSGTRVNQDAAYWVLIIAWYTGARREEICGLCPEDIKLHPIPHLVIQPNALRDVKTDSSERAVPISDELIRLGFLEYVEAIKETGATHLFPELWINCGKRGGDQYYAIVWSKLMDWLKLQPDFIMPLGSTGKGADFHSIRSTVLSQLDRKDINQNIVADIAGHQREGVTAINYQKLLQSGGLEDVLQERKSVLECVPILTAHLIAYKPDLMPLNIRSR